MIGKLGLDQKRGFWSRIKNRWDRDQSKYTSSRGSAPVPAPNSYGATTLTGQPQGDCPYQRM